MGGSTGDNGGMRTVVLGEAPADLAAFIERRRALGQDGYDEVWEGDYHVAPTARPVHGIVQDQVAGLLRPQARAVGLVASGPFNLGSAQDFRVPDGGYHRGVPTATFVPTAAVVVEVLSPDDETYAKFGFYAQRGVDELIVADPAERTVHCWRRRSDGAGYDECEASTVSAVRADELTRAIDWP